MHIYGPRGQAQDRVGTEPELQLHQHQVGPITEAPTIRDYSNNSTTATSAPRIDVTTPAAPRNN